MNNNNNNNEEIERISISEFAQRVGCSSQTIRNRIFDNELGLDVFEFQRGKMKGYLICVPKTYKYDEFNKKD